MLKLELIDKKPRGEVGIEAVSDAILTEDKTYLVQIKRNLTKAALEAAFAEAYDIASLCSNALRNQLRFQVVTMKREKAAVLNVELALNALRERTVVDNALLRRTLAMFDTEAPIRVSSDPAEALRLVLWNAGVENPSATMEGMLGGIVAAFNGRNREGVKDALIRALDKAKDDVRVPPRQAGRLFIPGDLKVVQSASNAKIVVDASPRLPDLQMGRFLDRKDLIGEVSLHAERWNAGLVEEISGQLPRLPAFCIRGRSGDGKSVLLLQLVASLLEQRKVAAITGLSTSDDLARWLRSRPCIQPAERVEGVELAYIDDFPNRIDTAAFARLISESFEFGARPAALLTCGAGDGMPKSANFHCDYFNMPPPSEQDRQLFNVWLGNGNHGRFDPEQSLAVMLADLRRPAAGETPLADQLKQELSRQGLWPAARHAIAANLFGIPGAVPTNQFGEFPSFAFEQSDIILRAERRDSGLEFGHAEYLEPIYRYWHKSANFLEAWGHDLGLAIVAALQTGEPRLARMLVGRMVDVQAMRKRLAQMGFTEEHAVSDLLGAAFAAADLEIDDVTMAPIMRQWLVAQRATARDFDQKLEARAAALFRERAVTSTNKAEIALQLANWRRDDPLRLEAWEQAHAYLEAEGEEPLVVEYYTRLASRTNADHQALVQKWLSRHRRSLATAAVLMAAIRANTEMGGIYRKMGFGLIGAHPQSSISGELIRTLAKEEVEPEYVGVISEWLTHDHPTQEIVATYAQLLKIKGARRYVARARDWLQQNVQQSGNHDLLARLIQIDGSRGLGALVEKWLDSHPHDPARYTIFGALLAHPRFGEPALRRALRLLGAPERNKHSRYLASVAGRVIKAMAPQDAAEFVKTVPPDLRPRFYSFRRARR